MQVKDYDNKTMLIRRSKQFGTGAIAGSVFFVILLVTATLQGESSAAMIAAFGAAVLLIVGLAYFVDRSVQLWIDTSGITIKGRGRIHWKDVSKIQQKRVPRGGIWIILELYDSTAPNIELSVEGLSVPEGEIYQLMSSYLAESPNR